MTDLSYAKKLLADAEAVLDEIKRGRTAKDCAKIGGAVNWADLHAVAASRMIELYRGADDFIETWQVRIDEASPGSEELIRRVTLGLIERGHPGVDVVTEW